MKIIIDTDLKEITIDGNDKIITEEDIRFCLRDIAINQLQYHNIYKIINKQINSQYIYKENEKFNIDKFYTEASANFIDDKFIERDQPIYIPQFPPYQHFISYSFTE